MERVTTDAKLVRCPKCRKAQEPAWSHCPFCGTDTSHRVPDEPTGIFPEKGAFDLFLHSGRREIYELICDMGSSSIVQIMRNATQNITENAVRWHLDKLTDAGMVKSLKIDEKSTVFYPAILRTEEVERAFSVLKSGIRKEIFRYVVQHDGCKRSDIAVAVDRHPATVSFHLDRMIKADIIHEQRVSKNLNRYALGDLGRRIVEGSVSCISRSYVNFLIEKLGENRPCFPRVEKQTPTELCIAVSSKYSDQDVIIKINLGNWDFWHDDLDEFDVGTMKFILGQGGVEILEQLARGTDVNGIPDILAIPDPVIRVKMRSLEELKLVENGKITLRGTRLSNRISQSNVG